VAEALRQRYRKARAPPVARSCPRIFPFPDGWTRRGLHPSRAIRSIAMKTPRIAALTVTLVAMAVAGAVLIVPRTAHSSRGGADPAKVLAAKGTALFKARRFYYRGARGTIACQQETRASYYCWDPRTGRTYLVTVANGVATWTAFSLSGGGIWSDATVAVTDAP
jgi:hypothetical protein